MRKKNSFAIKLFIDNYQFQEQKSFFAQILFGILIIIAWWLLKINIC